jgi:diguanylate cyclase (GGDEF)-like protein
MNDIPVRAGLPNRDLFDDRLQAALNQARRYGRGLALLRIDIAGGSFGEPAGVELQTEIARRLLGCVREADTVAWLGGSKFAIILGEMAHAIEAVLVARRVVDRLGEPCHLDDGTIRISSFTGIALYPQHGESSDQLLYSADTALSAAKENGGNGYHLLASTMQDDKAQPDLI